MKKFKNLFIYTAICASFALYSCEGPMGPAGKDGANGNDGLDANESCKECHNPTTVDIISTQYKFSKHSYGEAAFDESGNTGCSPCHAQEAFKFVCANNTPSTFSIVAPATTYSNNYAASSALAFGEMGCSTCHSSLHKTGGIADISPLTSVAPVAMTMWGGTKTINLTQDGGISNLCTKCHQPRPFTRTFGDKNVIDYAALISSPTTVFFDGANPTSTANVNTIRPSYRTHTHYGTQSAIFAGVGGVEFGSGYTNSQHTTVATCQACHMANVTGRAGGHTFRVRSDAGALTTSSAWNFNGCNVTGCHSTSPISATTAGAHWLGIRTEIKGLLNSLAAKLVVGGVDILNRNPNSTEGALVMVDGNPVSVGVNLWAGITTNNYDGYLNVYDPATNPTGPMYNNGAALKMFRNPNPSSSWTQAQKDFNLTLPILTLTNAQMGAIINFQLCLREYSLGIHNANYTRTLLTNSIAAIP